MVDNAMMGRLMQRAFLRIVASAVCASLLAACGGGGAPAVPAAGTQSHTSGRVAIALTFPSKTTAAKLGGRHASYIPTGTRGIGIDYAPSPAGYSNTTTDKTPMVGSSLVAGVAPCSSTNPDGSYSCTIYLPSVPVGYNDFKVTLWDAQPTGCNASGQNCDFTGANALSTTVNAFLAVKEGQNNNFSLGFAAQVDSVYVALSGGIVDGTSSAVTATLTLKDANGFTIVDAPSLYDKNGNALTISLNLPVNGSGSLSFPGPSNTMAFSSVGTSDNTVNVNYDGNYQFASSGGSQPSITATLNAGGAISGSIVNSPLAVTQSNNSVGVPGAPQVAKVNSSALTGTPAGKLAVGSDNNLWLAEGTKIAKVAAAGAVSESSAGVVDASGIGAGGDGYLYFMNADPNNGVPRLERFAPANPASVTSSGSITIVGGNGNSTNTFVTGADGDIYFPDDYEDGLYYFSPNAFTGTISNVSYQLGPGGYAYYDAIAGPPVAGTDPSICTVQVGSSSAIECFDTVLHGFVTSAGTTNATNGFLALGADGALYVGENGGLEQYTLNSGGVLIAHTFYALPSGGNVTGIARGRDGNVWFVESNGDVGKVATGSTAAFGAANVTEYAPAQTGSGSASPTGLTAGPASSNALYFYDSANHNVYSITP